MLKVMIAEDDLFMADMLEDIFVDAKYEACGIARTPSTRRSNSASATSLILQSWICGWPREVSVRKIRRPAASPGRPGILYATGNAGNNRLTKVDGEACLGKTGTDPKTLFAH